MKYIEAPTEYQGKERSLFLAGGITGCPDWQADLTDLLTGEEIVLLNPRRSHFSTDNQNITPEQINWEHKHLQKADAISFWFPQETACPITLYELGAHSKSNKPLFVGVHPEYARREDVEIQTRLERPEIEIVYNLNNLSKKIKGWVNKK
ncbi:nucleoside 2-deoxyribosyltransferase domain-containing protein [Candidatus Woesearchaeota archaeon]|nr:nucleoside 2-deoxyribosyltransferase domain-containing protein [Candidatus Woesearchaeota archaeon]